tara:strand:+ start:201 stop:812 length:612 start_codon:yes stop_codon:yes gene_type:complete
MKKYYYKINRKNESIFQKGSGVGNAHDQFRAPIQNNAHEQSTIFNSMVIGDTIIVHDTDGETGATDNKLYRGILCEKNDLYGIVRLDIKPPAELNIKPSSVPKGAKKFADHVLSEMGPTLYKKYKSISNELIAIQPSSSFSRDTTRTIDQKQKDFQRLCKISPVIVSEAKKPVTKSTDQKNPGDVANAPVAPPNPVDGTKKKN